MLKDGLITVASTEQDGASYQAISVPTALYPGLIHALHRKLNHPSKAQLTKLIARYFYSPGYHRVVEEVTNACEMCMAIKQLPKEIFTETTGTRTKIPSWDDRLVDFKIFIEELNFLDFIV